MSEAAHPQQGDPAAADADAPLAVKNPFPTSMTVPGPDGRQVAVELATLDGNVFAPGLDALGLEPHVRQYVTQYCAMWSASVVTTGALAQRWPMPPRRGQLQFTASQLHAMLALAADERLVSVIAEPLTGSLRFVVESPRLAPMGVWNVEPPPIGLPISAWYEGRQGDGDPGGLAAAHRQLEALRVRAKVSAQEWENAIAEAERKLAPAGGFVQGVGG